MARIVNTISTPILTLVIRTMFKDGTFTDELISEGDIVSDLRYVHNGEIKKISGRVSNITYKNAQVKRTYNTFKKLKSYFRFDVTPVSIEIDSSTELHSNVTVIPTRDILEREGVTEVKKLNVFFKYGFASKIYFSDNTSNVVTIHEGDIVSDLVYLSKLETKVNAKIVAIKYDKVLKPLKLETIISNKIKEIDVCAIKEIGTTTPIIESGTVSINDAITDSSSGSIYVGTGTFKDPISVSKDVSLNGDKAGISAFSAVRDTKTLKDETIIEGALKIITSNDVNVDGVALTKDALVSTGPANNVAMNNCILTALNPDANKSFVVKTGNTPTLMNVEGCYFGNNKSVDGKSFRNTLELNCKLKDGTVFSNNYFAKECSGNNDICIYDVDEGANILIENNTWEYSGNGIRIGTKGNARCTITINNNTYNSTDEANPEYAGLVLIQPYGSATTSMKNVTVYINNTHHKDDKQIFYLYSGGNDMKFTEDTLPTVYVDGVLQDLSKYING